ncbi:MAG: hypothetical protein ACSLFP_01205 [Acidimicrobiales bacterium]
MAALGMADKIVGLDDALEGAGLAHAFGGALALAYCTREVRNTQDIDVNVFIGADRTPELEAALPRAITVTEPDRLRLRRDAQTRLWWDDTPVDIFLSNHPFHDHAAANRRRVPFGDREIPVLACADLGVFKAFFGRMKDALDLAAMAHAHTIDLLDLRATVDELLGGDERRAFFQRVDEALDELTG